MREEDAEKAEGAIPLQGSGTDLPELEDESSATWQQMVEKNVR